MRFRTRALMLAWAPHSGGGEGLAERLGLPNRFVHYFLYQRPWVAPAKYPLQAAATLRLLLDERPAVVVVQNPPVLAPLVVDLYARLTGARYVVNSHTGAFYSSRWRWSLPIQAWLGRRALATIVTNDTLAEVVRGWGARPLVIVNPPKKAPALPPRQAPDTFTAFMVSTFAADEPTAEVLEVARALPDVQFVVTGDLAGARPEWIADKPANVEYTGFLRGTGYYEHMWQANTVLVLCTVDDTMQHGALEALDLGQPLVTSDWPLLRDYFNRGTIHVPNTVAGIMAGVREMRAREPVMRQEMAALREERQRDWQAAADELGALIDSVWTRVPHAQRGAAPAPALARPATS
jgi:glycosyltransferase involved in cell wall biosynthesis